MVHFSIYCKPWHAVTQNLRVLNNVRLWCSEDQGRRPRRGIVLCYLRQPSEAAFRGWRRRPEFLVTESCKTSPLTYFTLPQSSRIVLVAEMMYNIPSSLLASLTSETAADSSNTKSQESEQNLHSDLKGWVFFVIENATKRPSFLFFAYAHRSLQHRILIYSECLKMIAKACLNLLDEKIVTVT